MTDGDGRLKAAVGRVTDGTNEEDAEFGIIEKYLKDAETFCRKYGRVCRNL